MEYKLTIARKPGNVKMFYEKGHVKQNDRNADTFRLLFRHMQVITKKYCEKRTDGLQ